MSGAICGGKDWEERRVLLCPTEGRRRRFYVWGAHWYSPVWTCLGCGDSWSDGERGYRPFARGWRQEAIAGARRDWRESFGRRLTRKAAMEDLRRQLERREARS